VYEPDRYQRSERFNGMNHYRITFATGNGQKNLVLTRVLEADGEAGAREDFERIFRPMYPKHLVTKCEAIR